jgi:acetylornithine/succinyldiaminopimelate/putrescine aminotransferase
MDFTKDTFLRHLAPTNLHPFLIPVERAEGVWLFTPDGKKYMDMIAGIGVTNIGHRHPKVVQAIKDQIEKHLHVMVYGEYIQSAPNRLAKTLTSLLPPSLDSCYFVNSGTEANEGALKLAKRVTGRTGIVSFRKSYHGSTHGTLSVSGNETKKAPFRPLLPDVNFLRFNNVDDLVHITARTACVIMETVQGDAGVRVPSQDFMRALRQRCDDSGALLILDEIQCGMGRCGTLFAFEQFGITPDIVTIAKAFGGGLPIGAFISSHNNMSLLAHDPPLGHITTFGGNPVCCASALASLEVITGKGLLASVEEKGRRIEQRLKHRHIREVRRIGLMMAFDFDSEERVQRIVDESLSNGVICFWFLSHPNSFRLAPPLNITDEEIDIACDVIMKAIEAS